MVRWMYLGGVSAAIACALVLGASATRWTYGSGEAASSSGARGGGSHGVVDAAREGGKARGKAGKAKLLKEGKRTRSVGTVVRAGRGRTKFRVKTGEFTMLENSVLEKLEAHAGERVRIDARVTTYRGRNYLWVLSFEFAGEAGGASSAGR